MSDDVQQRAAEVIAGVIDRKHGAIAEGDYYATAEHIADALAAFGLLVAPDARTDHADWHERNGHE